MIRVMLVAAFAALTFVAEPALALRPHSNGPNTGFGKPGYDPNKMICVSRDVVGSRLQSVRECHTAQQWEEQKAQEQVGLNRQQVNGDAGCNFNGGSDPACGIRNGGKDTPW
jgi:hypothetical protein